MKKYLVLVKKITTTEIMVSERSKEKAINKVDGILNKSIKLGVNLDKIFKTKPLLSYKIKKINKDK